MASRVELLFWKFFPLNFILWHLVAGGILQYQLPMYQGSYILNPPINILPNFNGLPQHEQELGFGMDRTLPYFVPNPVPLDFSNIGLDDHGFQAAGYSSYENGITGAGFRHPYGQTLKNTANNFDGSFKTPAVHSNVQNDFDYTSVPETYDYNQRNQNNGGNNQETYINDFPSDYQPYRGAQMLYNNDYQSFNRDQQRFTNNNNYPSFDQDYRSSQYSQPYAATHTYRTDSSSDSTFGKSNPSFHNNRMSFTPSFVDPLTDYTGLEIENYESFLRSGNRINGDILRNNQLTTGPSSYPQSAPSNTAGVFEQFPALDKSEVIGSKTRVLNSSANRNGVMKSESRQKSNQATAEPTPAAVATSRRTTSRPYVSNLTTPVTEVTTSPAPLVFGQRITPIRTRNKSLISATPEKIYLPPV